MRGGGEPAAFAATIWKIETPTAKYIRRLRLDAVKQNIYTHKRLARQTRHAKAAATKRREGNIGGNMGGKREAKQELSSGHANETLKPEAKHLPQQQCRKRQGGQGDIKLTGGPCPSSPPLSPPP